MPSMRSKSIEMTIFHKTTITWKMDKIHHSRRTRGARITKSVSATAIAKDGFCNGPNIRIGGIPKAQSTRTSARESHRVNTLLLVKA